jgi:FixJ family two-component response regulator
VVARASFVRSLGYEVLLFDSAQGFQGSAFAPETGCLLLDVHMTGMSGKKMHEHLSQKGVAPPTIFITAFASSWMRLRLTHGGVPALLEKPFSFHELADWLARTLGVP